MEDMLWSFFLEHGWKLTLIALSGIPFLGILKRAHVFDKIENKNARKALIEGISSAFSIIVSLIYLLVVNKFNFGKFAILSGGILMLNQTAYVIYENFGIRTILNKGLNIMWDFIKRLFASKADSSSATDSDENIDLIDDLPKNDKK